MLINSRKALARRPQLKQNELQNLWLRRVLLPGLADRLAVRARWRGKPRLKRVRRRRFQKSRMWTSSRRQARLPKASRVTPVELVPVPADAAVDDAVGAAVVAADASKPWRRHSLRRR